MTDAAPESVTTPVHALSSIGDERIQSSQEWGLEYEPALGSNVTTALARRAVSTHSSTCNTVDRTAAEITGFRLMVAFGVAGTLEMVAMASGA